MNVDFAAPFVCLKEVLCISHVVGALRSHPLEKKQSLQLQWLFQQFHRRSRKDADDFWFSKGLVFMVTCLFHHCI